MGAAVRFEQFGDRARVRVDRGLLTQRRLEGGPMFTVLAGANPGAAILPVGRAVLYLRLCLKSIWNDHIQ